MPLKYKVLTLPAVDSHIFEIAQHIAKDSPNAAVEFIENFEKQVISLEQLPLRGSLARDPLIQGVGYRQLIHGDYRTIYRVLGENVIFVDVVHGARQIGKLEE